MEKEIICLDTSVLIDYYRKKDKTNSFFYSLNKTHKSFAISVITEYEIMVGSNNEQDEFWKIFFSKLLLLPYNSEVNNAAIAIYRKMKKQNKLLAVPDLLIAATSMSNKIPIATLNQKHFEKVDGLKIIAP